MVNENKIVELINGTLSGAMTDIRFSGAKFYGLTEVYPKDKERLPAEIGKNGELKFVSIDDTFPVIIYHRCISTNVIQDKPNQFGDRRDEKETSNMSLFVFAQSEKVKMNGSELKRFVGDLMPQIIDKVSCIELGIKSGLVYVNGCNFNGLENFKKEFKVTRQFDPQFLFIEIKYSIETRYTNICVKTFCCN